MLDFDSRWWKYIEISKLSILITQVMSEHPEIKYITPTEVRELALLDETQGMLGIIEIASEEVTWF